MTPRDFNQLIAEIKLNLRSEVDHSTMDGKGSMIANVFTLKLGLIYRIYDLGIGAYKCANDDNIASGKVLTRALLETTAVTAYLQSTIAKYIKTRDVEVFNTKVKKLLLGSKGHGKEFIEAINIMDCIRIVEKNIRGFQIFYDILSDFSHPNLTGTCGLYGELKGNEPTQFSIKPKDSKKHKTETIDLICYALDAFIHYNIEIDKNIDALVEQYNQDKTAYFEGINEVYD